MKKTLCLYFQVHQPLRLRQYRFFDIGKDHYYYDDFTNRSIMRKVADRCYLRSNELMLDLIKKYGKRFKISFSISGTAIEQFEQFAPEVLDSFKTLAQTGSVEFLSETYSHSLASVKDIDEFRIQVEEHAALMQKCFGTKPVTFRNTELIYSDEIGDTVARMGYSAMLAEGAKHVLGWKSPNYIYTNAINPRLKILLRNYGLSDDIAFRFSNREWNEWPLTVEKYVTWLSMAAKKDELINLFMDYETFGEHQGTGTGIFSFLRHFPAQIFSHSDFEFLTPAEVIEKHQPVAPLHVPYVISWADEERDLSAWLGNELQNEAFDQLYRLKPKIEILNEEKIWHEFRSLQASDHFYYMCTKFFSDGAVHKYFTPYNTPYEAFINYMNVLSDFIVSVEKPIAKESISIPNKQSSKKTRTLHPKNKEQRENNTSIIQTENTTLQEDHTAPNMATKKTVAKKTTKKATTKKKTTKKATPATKITVKKTTTPKTATVKKVDSKIKIIDTTEIHEK